MSVAAIRMAAWRAANPEKAKAAQDRKNAARRKGSRPSTYQHSEIDNVIPACRSCNSTKKDRGILVMLPKKAA